MPENKVMTTSCALSNVKDKGEDCVREEEGELWEVLQMDYRDFRDSLGLGSESDDVTGGRAECQEDKVNTEEELTTAR